jgi:hypothetical protein
VKKKRRNRKEPPDDIPIDDTLIVRIPHSRYQRIKMAKGYEIHIEFSPKELHDFASRLLEAGMEAKAKGQSLMGLTFLSVDDDVSSEAE